MGIVRLCGVAALSLLPLLATGESIETGPALQADPGDGQVLLTWKDASRSYSIRYRSADATPWVVLNGARGGAHKIAGLVNLKSYEFQLGFDDRTGMNWSPSAWARPHGTAHPSGLHAGGQVNAIVKIDNSVWVAGGDVSGFHRSIDGGQSWFHSSRGLVVDSGSRAVAALAYHPSGILYGISGDSSYGNFYRSTDAGQSWTRVAAGPSIPVEGNSTTYPREVGRLIAVDPTNARTIYLASQTGLMKSVDGGGSWSTLALGGKILRSAVMDSGVVYVGADDGVYRCTASGSCARFTGNGAPAIGEELLVIGPQLYVAADTDGVRRLTQPASASPTAPWTNLGIPTAPGVKWCALDGYASGGAHVLVVGNADSAEEGASSRHTTLQKCANANAVSGFRWTNISSASGVKVSLDVAGRNGETWWRIDPNKGEGVASGWAAGKRLDGADFNIDQIAIDPSNTNKILVVGQMGIWRTLDGGQTWEPAVEGLGAAVHNAITVDPSAPGRVYVGDTDNGLWVSTDDARSVAYATRPPSGAKPTVRSIAIDASTPVPHDLYVAVGQADPAGEVWRYDPRARLWSPVEGPTGLSLNDMTAGLTVMGVATGHANGALVLLAAVENGGIWRKVGSENWENVAPAASGVMSGAFGGRRASFAWADGTSTVYLFDRRSGIWRSRNAGLTWTLIWAKRIPGGFGATGDIALLMGSTSLFASAHDGLWRIERADRDLAAGTEPTAINLNIPSPGQLAADGFTLWVTGTATATGTDAVVLRKSTDGGNTFTTFADDYYQGAAGFCSQLAVVPGHQFTAASSMGTVVSER